MKKKDNISYLSQAFMALAFMGVVSACVEDAYDEVAVNKEINETLTLAPTIADAQVKTRTASFTDLMEDNLVTLDVFVEGVTDASFWKQYHLTIANATAETLEDKVHYLLEGKWREAGYKSSDKYNVYVAVNNPKTKENINNVTALKALVYNENEDNAIINENGTFKWVNNQPAGDIYKLYTSESIEYTDDQGQTQKWRALTNEKQFMMDGVIPNWSPDPSLKHQDFNVDLKRAAAKFILNVEFNETFLQTLKEDGVAIEGSPAWKFNNFAFGAPVFTPETASAGVEVHNSDFNIFHNEPFAGDKKEFKIVTYSYPNKWEAADYSTKSPSLIISVPYTQYESIGDDGTPVGTGVTSYNYYRIPIVKSTVTSIDRNTLYVVNATISTRGSDSHDDVDPIEDIYYKVTSWNNEDNEDQESGDVVSVQHYYLQVNPKVYTLRGDGEQSIDIHFSRAKNTSVDYKLFTFPSGAVDLSNNNPINKTAVTPSNNNAVWGWYFSDDKRMITSVSGLTHMGVTITNNDPEAATAGDTEGSFTIKSTALENRAIKYILMRVYLKDENGNDKSGDGYYEDVLIRHFPTDNIQSTEGKWSSRTTNGWWSYNQSTYSYTWYDNYSQQTLRNVFYAKYYDNGVRYANGESISHLDNPYKYVIQLSSTSEQYVMGRPALDNNGQSDDHVVSPAFMIASQLGATSSKSPANNQIATMAGYAANHCRTYKEVDVTGAGVEGETLWTNWRLPTREEVGVILKYQNAGYDTMEPVLTGRYYWTLEGAAVATGVNDQWANPITWYNDWETRYQNTANDYRYGTYRGTDTYGRPNQNVQESSFIRCIRDLSAEEIENINKWNTIIAKYQAKHN